MKTPVKDNPDLVRDETNNAILNTNLDALRAYKRQKAKMQDVEDLKSRVINIENMLALILEKLD